MNIKVHYSFVIYIFILFFLGLLNYFLVFFISILIHEITHAVIGMFYGLKIKNIGISMGGVSIEFDNFNLNYIKKIVIYATGPVMNLFLSLVTYCIFKERYIFFVLTNLALAIFNLIPLYPLDGGKIIYEIVNKFFYLKKTILKDLYIGIQIILLCLLAFFCINYSNVQLFFLGVYFLNFTRYDKYKNIELF